MAMIDIFKYIKLIQTLQIWIRFRTFVCRSQITAHAHVHLQNQQINVYMVCMGSHIAKSWIYLVILSFLIYLSTASMNRTILTRGNHQITASAWWQLSYLKYNPLDLQTATYLFILKVTSKSNKYGQSFQGFY